MINFEDAVSPFLLDFFASVPDIASNEIVRTQLDCTPVVKPHSPTLADRQFVHVPNETIKGNKPISIGYPLSLLNIGFDAKWSIPVYMQRVLSTQSSTSVGVSQLLALAQSSKFASKFIVNTADSGYGQASFLSPTHAQENLCSIVRLKTRNVWEYSPKSGTGGANKIYGAVYNRHFPPKNLVLTFIDLLFFVLQ